MLFVSPEFPWPPYSGGRLRTLSLLRCLRTHFEIHCVTFSEVEPHETEKDRLKSYVSELTILPLRPHHRTAMRRYFRNAGRALRFVPPLVDRFSEPDARRALAVLLQKQSGWIWLEHLWLAPYVVNVSLPAIAVLDAHNVESDYYRQLRQACHRWIDGLGYYIFERAAARIERCYLSSFDCILTASEEDRQLLVRNCTPEKIFIVPNAVELPPLSPTENPAEQTLCFAGRLDYPPNLAAAVWFLRQVWPRVRSQLPKAKWCVVGAFPELLEPEVRGDSRIVLAGRVEEMEPYLRLSSVVIVPLHSGGGTRFKILEAWAAAKAVVSTSKGATGLAAQHGSNIWIADTPEDFASAIVRLLSDPGLRSRFGKRGWETVQERYSSERLQESLEIVLRGAQARIAKPGCA